MLPLNGCLRHVANSWRDKQRKNFIFMNQSDHHHIPLNDIDQIKKCWCWSSLVKQCVILTCPWTFPSWICSTQCATVLSMKDTWGGHLCVLMSGLWWFCVGSQGWFLSDCKGSSNKKRWWSHLLYIFLYISSLGKKMFKSKLVHIRTIRQIKPLGANSKQNVNVLFLLNNCKSSRYGRSQVKVIYY